MKIIGRLIICGLLMVMSVYGYSQDNALTIEQAITTAFKNSPEIRGKLSQIRKSQGAFAESKTATKPTVTAEISHTQQGPAVSISIPDVGTAEISPSHNTSGVATLAMPVDISGKFGLISDLSRYQIELDKLALESTVQNLIYNVKTSSLNYLRAKEAQKVAQASVDSSAARLKNTKAKYEAGSVPKFDVTRAEVELANFQQRLISSRNAILTARAALNSALGIGVSEPTDVQSIDVQVNPPAMDIDVLTADAYAKRPDVRSVDTAIKLGKRNLKLQQTGNKPTGSIVGTFNHNFKAAGFSGQKDSWMAIFAVQLPVWDGGVTRTKVDQAKAQIDISQDSLEQAKLGVALDVKVATVNIQDATERVSAAKSSVALAEEALRLANVRYDAGISTLVEVTDAESALSEARFNHVNALYDYATAIADLERSTYNQPEMQLFQQTSAVN